MPTITLPGRVAAESRSRAVLSPWLLPCLLALIAIAEQCVLGLDNDVSWLITVGEHVLAGQRLYVDIVETNPPAAVLIYLPAIVVARLIGVRSELAVACFLFALAAPAIGSAGRLAERGGLLSRAERLPALLAAILCFMLLPGACFAEREHVALLTLLPMMAVTGLRAEGRPVRPWVAIVAGIGAGITMAIKPHFVLAVAPMILFAMTKRRSFRPAFMPENVAAAVLVLAYGAVALSLFPAFFTQVLPILRAVYLPVRAPAKELRASPAMQMFGVAMLLAAWLGGRRLARTRIALPLLAALGFAAAMLVQGKGFLNHDYPSVALAFFALALLLLEGGQDRGKRRFAGFACAILMPIGCCLFAHIYRTPRLDALVARLAPPDPSLIDVGGNLSVGFPLTRQLDGRWVGRSHSLWVTVEANAMLSDTSRKIDAAGRRALIALTDRDAQTFVEDVERQHPDIVLVEGWSGRKWISERPAVSRVLAPYRWAGEADNVFVLVRRTRA